MPPVNSGWHVNESGLNGTECPAQHRGNWSLVDSVRGIDEKSRTDALGMRAYMAAPPASVGSAFLHKKSPDSGSWVKQHEGAAAQTSGQGNSLHPADDEAYVVLCMYVRNANASPVSISISLEADCVNRKTAHTGRLASMGDDVCGGNQGGSAYRNPDHECASFVRWSGRGRIRI